MTLPPYLIDESYAIFADSVVKFFDRVAPWEVSEGWRDAGIVPREAWRAAGAAGMLGYRCPSNMAAAAAILGTNC